MFLAFTKEMELSKNSKKEKISKHGEKSDWCDIFSRNIELIITRNVLTLAKLSGKQILFSDKNNTFTFLLTSGPDFHQ